MIVIIVLLSSIAGLAAGQSQPDFSGQWVLLAPAEPDAAIARELTVRQEVQRTTVTGAPMTPYFKTLRVDRHFASGVRSESHEIGIVGGSVSGRVGGPRSTRSVKWDGDRLVMENASYAGDAFTERREVWSFDPQRRLVLTITDRGSAMEPRSATFTYRSK